MEFDLHIIRKAYFLTKLAVFLIAFFVFSCKNNHKPPEKDVVKKPEQLEDRTKENLQKIFNYAENNKGKLNKSVKLVELPLMKLVYTGNNYQTVWSHEDNWKPIADSLFHMVENAKDYGLFPNDYHINFLSNIRRIIARDSVSRRDAALWARADLLFTEAFFHLARHLKAGRLGRDSITLRNDSLLNDAFYLKQFSIAISSGHIVTTLEALEPRYPGYRNIRQGIPSFLKNANFRKYTYIYYPYKDSLLFLKSVQRRLMEEGIVEKPFPPSDTLSMKQAVLNYQKVKKFKPTGKVSESLVRALNNTDEQKFKSIAVALDHYKLLPDTVPATYILVNLPSYTLYVYSDDTLSFRSKVIVGAPSTKTPLLNSMVSDFITYPQWTVPYSIVFRDMLPKIQRSIEYLYQQNLMVVDRNDSVINPASVNWAKMSKTHFPYLIRQKEGDDNSLGVIKFNFVNKYSVYLHDTNARWLFAKSNRALSHGCVRVKDWEGLSHFLTSTDTLRFPPDSLTAWIERQEKHTITGFPKVPLYIRYFTVEGMHGTLRFYSDIYGYDRMVREKYFARRSVI